MFIFSKVISFHNIFPVTKEKELFKMEIPLVGDLNPYRVFMPGGVNKNKAKNEIYELFLNKLSQELLMFSRATWKSITNELFTNCFGSCLQYVYHTNKKDYLGIPQKNALVEIIKQNKHLLEEDSLTMTLKLTQQEDTYRISILTNTYVHKGSLDAIREKQKMNMQKLALLIAESNFEGDDSTGGHMGGGIFMSRMNLALTKITGNILVTCTPDPLKEPMDLSVVPNSGFIIVFTFSKDANESAFFFQETRTEEGRIVIPGEKLSADILPFPG